MNNRVRELQDKVACLRAQVTTVYSCTPQCTVVHHSVQLYTTVYSYTPQYTVVHCGTVVQLYTAAKLQLTW